MVRCDNVHTFGHLQVYFMYFHQKAFRLAHNVHTFMVRCACVCMHVSSRFLWYLSSYLCPEIVIMFHLLSLFSLAIYGYRITKCVCFYIDLLPIFSLATSCSVLFFSAFVPFYDCRRFHNASFGRLVD